jgi:hypothetical protein
MILRRHGEQRQWGGVCRWEEEVVVVMVVEDSVWQWQG